MFKLKLFIIIEILLALMGLYNMSRDTGLLSKPLLSVLLIVWGFQRLKRYGKGGVFLTLGFVSLLILFLSNPIAWLMILVAAVYFIFMKDNVLQNFFFRNKQNLDFTMLRTTDPQKKSNRRVRYRWFGQNSIGQETYEWDDINLFMVTSDTIIDLKETILPMEDSVITLQIIFGRARIIVPSDIGIHIIYHTLLGELHFNEERYKLRNETIDMYSDNYDESVHHLKIVTNVGFGEIEVIRI